VAPRAIDAGTVPYPEGATGDAVVTVEVVVEKDGSVQDARIVEGREPFAGAVLRAATSWRYEPARRGDVAVVARVRMRVTFAAPMTGAGASAGAGAGAGTSTGASTTAIEQVTVRGARHENARASMTAGEVRQIPGAFGDAFRAVEALPGVTPIVSGLPYFFVRGAPPGNTGYFVDGIRVPLLYHLAAGPSVIHPGLVDRVEFFPGGFPARYGRFAGGIVAGETIAPADHAHGEANLRLYDVGALLESPFASGRGTALVAGRYGYPGLIAQLISPETRLSYWDYQTRATWMLSDRDRVGAFVFGSYDYLGNQNQRRGTTKTIFETQFCRADLRWDRELGRAGRMRAAITLGMDTTTTEDGLGVRDRVVGVRMIVEEKLSPVVRVRGGFDAWLDHYDLEPTGRPIDDARNDNLYPPRNDVVWGAHGDLVLRVHPRVELVPGVRFDLFASTLSRQPARSVRNGSAVLSFPPADTGSAAPAVDPRFATRVMMTDALTLVSTFGVSHQPPSFFIPIPGLQLGRLDEGLQTSIQLSQGIEIALPEGFTAAPTLFVHNYLGLTDATAACASTSGFDPNDDCVDRRLRGRTFGLELLVKRSLTKRLTGWLAYTLSRSTRESHPLGSPERTQHVPSEFDRTHVVSLIGAYDLGRNWRIGGRFFFYTGRPYSNRIQGISVPPYYTERLPPFHRIDLRIEKRWYIRPTTWIALVIEGLNVTARKEPTGVDCEPAVPASGAAARAGNAPYDVCQPEEIGPVTIPSLGVEASF
jgi:TonB family protein